jgi:branched-chain amino acid transport system permease protein
MTVFLSALVIGLFLGTIYATMALGLVASYRISRVVNLGLPGVAAGGAYVYWWMSQVWGAPTLIALVGALGFGGLVGAGLGFANLWMRSWPRGLVMIFTLTVTLLLFSWVDKQLPQTPVFPPSPFGSGGFGIWLTFISWHELGTLFVCLAVTAGAGLLIKRTRLGVYVRAIYDDPAGAATVGIPYETFVVGVWAAAGLLGAMAGILITPRTQLNSLALLFVTIWALAGSVLGGVESFPLAFAGSVVLGLSQGVLGGVLAGDLGPGMENLSAIVVMAAAVFYAGTKRRGLAYVQT